MAYDNLPFEKGKTLYGGSVPSSGANYAFIGHEFDARDSATGRKVRVRAVKNASGITLYGKQPVTLIPNGTEINGYARLPTDRFVGLDDGLDSNGVVANDVCYVVVKGPCLLKTAAANLISIVAGDKIVAATAANSTAAGTTAAGINKIGAPGDATSAITLNDGVQARAVTAATTNNTETAIRVNIDARLV